MTDVSASASPSLAAADIKPATTTTVAAPSPNPARSRSDSTRSNGNAVGMTHWSKLKVAELSAGTVHVTSQPEVDEAVKEVEGMNAYFTELNKMALNETEQELALFFQQKGYQEKVEDISAMSIDIGKAYSEGVKHRQQMIASVEGFGEFVKTFKDKAVQDSIDTMRRQESSRVEFDSLHVSKKSTHYHPRQGTSPQDTSSMTPAERELEHARVQFAAARSRYQNLSTAIIDKAVLLEMKRDVDYRTQLERLVKIRHGIALSWTASAGSVGGGFEAEDAAVGALAAGYPVGVYQTPMSE
ncbi:Arfaptin-like domain-containing protein [Chytridium lagenaria]|nr:Arfaptin-like domain-containing protein [Chytridium lagenaria]